MLLSKEKQRKFKIKNINKTSMNKFKLITIKVMLLPHQQNLMHHQTIKIWGLYNLTQTITIIYLTVKVKI